MRKEWQPSTDLSFPQNATMKRALDRNALQSALAEIPGAVVHVHEGRPPFLVDVITTHWEGIDEGFRQREVWQKLIDHFSDEDLAKVEFIYTDTPEERAEYEREARQASGG